MVGQTGSSKHELVQLAAIMTDSPMLEVVCPAFGEPLEFAYNFRQMVLSVAKFNKGCYIVINDQHIRDPVYYDYIYNFMSQLCRHESFVLYDSQFEIDLCAIEAQHIKKNKKVKMPNENVLFKMAVQRVQKNIHLVFLISDLMTYKECFSIFPQYEYNCEVMFLYDLNSNDYLQMAD